MDMEMEEYRSGKKSLELICYIGGAGAFGVLLRWLQQQLAFNEMGLPDKSALHAVLVLFVLAAGGMFLYFIRLYEKQRLFIPDDFSLAFSNTGKFYRILSILAGLILCAGAVLLFLQTDADRNSSSGGDGKPNKRLSRNRG